VITFRSRLPRHNEAISEELPGNKSTAREVPIVEEDSTILLNCLEVSVWT
jgi:hypothetical protein